MQMSVNGQDFAVSILEEFRSQLAHVHDSQFAEVSVSKGEIGESDALFVLINGDRAMLVLLDGDCGSSSRDPEYSGPGNAVMKFKLSNGQVDEYPVRWTVPTDEALRALEFYFEHGELAPWIRWHDDSQKDDYPWHAL
jgi:hypothetical protein